MKKVYIVLILISIIEIGYLVKPEMKIENKVEEVGYKEQKDKGMFAYYINDVESSNHETWPSKDDYMYVKARCYDGEGNEQKTSEVFSFNEDTFTATVDTNATSYCYLYFNEATSALQLIRNHSESGIKNASGTLENGNNLQVRNEAIEAEAVRLSLQIPSDTLRRFIGSKDQVTDNFICFGTDEQTKCLENLDQYMYRIIGIDVTSNQIKIIKATMIMNGIYSEFPWASSGDGDLTWELSEAYKYLNSPEVNENEIKSHFVGNPYYSYMKDINWTNLIVAHPTWHPGAVQELNGYPNYRAYVYERSKKLENGNSISLMYASDFLYAGVQGKTNWLFIQNGLNGTRNTGTRRDGSPALQLRSEDEWTMAKRRNSGYALYVDSEGLVQYSQLGVSRSVRPAFYLDADNLKLSGNGTIGVPYLISGIPD